MKQKAYRILINCLILAALAGIVFVACKSDSGEVSSFDEDSPHLVSVFPADGSTDVPVSALLTVSFDESMNPSTISYNSDATKCSGSLQLSRDGFFSCVPLSAASLSFGPDKKVFSISPFSPLEGLTNYRIKITTSAKDLSLNPLGQDFISAAGFTTGAGGGGPLSNAQAIYFGDQNTNEFVLSGTVDIVRALDESDITGYTLYWGSSPNEKLIGQAPIRSFLVSETTLKHELTNVTIPANATHFLVYSQNQKSETISPLSKDIPDTVLKMVADICPGAVGSDPKHLVEYAGKLFFSADGCNGEGVELWAFDGTSAIMAKNIWIGSESSLPGKKVVYHGKLYFPAQDATNDIELWSYDDSNGNAIKVADINTSGSSNPEMLTMFNETLYFQAIDNGAAGNELWYHNDATTNLAYNIDSSGDSSPAGFTKYQYDNLLYFAANGGSGNKFWSYGGEPSAPMSVPGNCANISFPLPPLGAEFYNYRDKLFFRAYDPATGVEPWYYDGIDCYLLQNISDTSTDSAPMEFREYHGRLYFQAQNSFNGRELWVYDGTTDALGMVSDIEPSGSSFPSFLTYYKGMLIFNARTNLNGIELYGYDDYDESSSPFMIADINVGSADSKPEFLTVFPVNNYPSSGRLYFAADDGFKGSELWVFYIE